MSTTTSTEQPSTPSRFSRGRVAFRRWRWQRPFWAGVLTILAGLPIAYFPYANLTLGELTIRMATTAGAGSAVIGALLVTLGLTMWFQPHARIFAGVAGIMLSLVSLVVSNFGGFLIGFLFGLVGGGMSVAWVQDVREPQGGEKTGQGSAGAGDEDPRTAELPEGRVPAQRAAGTGSALAGFAGVTTEQEKETHRAE
ncbi:DUF6114 domain-containing protein [Streptomyces sp. ACA25]|uniref:DUF6114 domain-containing protein n=1 Tax=Streptomyces sp. ACA25 TaxID=3022596 RepID=UPI002307AB40|nr:DUF6114 domain-containing protein [Streptomyces sp. ACA25]MDB1087665.1 DUF6114 domain-containing protein [Streptomyces sp. ACA25]